MQDRYAGDIGDFGKFSLLRRLFSAPEDRIGVVWYRYPDESHNDDGRHINYLHDPCFMKCDAYLVKQLSYTVNGQRSIAELESLRLLPDQTAYFSNILDAHLIHPQQTIKDKTARKVLREQWLIDAVNAVSKCNIIFLDPDNGLEISSLPQLNRSKSGKYAYYSEVAEFFNYKNICVIYHHLNRNKPHTEQIIFRAKELKEKIPDINCVFALRYKPYSPRVFFILTHINDTETTKSKIHEFLLSNCGNGWDSYYEN